jgi:hypothetical protein
MKIRNYYLALLIFAPAYSSISIVYNIRIAETSKQLDVVSSFSKPCLAIFTPFGTFRKKYNGTKHYAAGGLFTLLYSQISETFFLRADWAVASVGSQVGDVHSSHTQTDDLLFSAGYSVIKSSRLHLTASGLVGFPTHRDTSLQEVQFGYGHYGLGGQLDGSWRYSHNRNHTLRAAARFIHFFPRKVEGPSEKGVFEIFNFSMGNVADIFLAHYSKMSRQSLEVGYNASFFFGARICPSYREALVAANYIRNSFYGIYKYRFPIAERQSIVAAAFSYGFEPTPKIVGNKRLILVWGSWGINF